MNAVTAIVAPAITSFAATTAIALVVTAFIAISLVIAIKLHCAATISSCVGVVVAEGKGSEKGSESLGDWKPPKEGVMIFRLCGMKWKLIKNIHGWMNVNACCEQSMKKYSEHALCGTNTHAKIFRS
jgi:hypothetical protein